MQILVRHNIVIDYSADGYVCTGSTVVCPGKGCNFEECSIVTVDVIPTDIDDFTYFYEAGKFIKGIKKIRDYIASSTITAQNLVSTETTPTVNGQINWLYE